MVGRPAWYDVEMRGRRLEATYKRMNTQFHKLMEEGNFDLAFAFYDRMLKTEHALQPYIEQITGVRELIKKGTKVASIIHSAVFPNMTS